MKAPKDKMAGIHIYLLGNIEELNKITTTFEWLKKILGINKTELYKKALLWIAKNNKIKAEFIKYVQDEKAQILKELLNHDESNGNIRENI
jgi:hypothetical protein